jgi:hypothetical protein
MCWLIWGNVSDPNGSTYYNNGAGSANYTPPGGKGK